MRSVVLLIALLCAGCGILTEADEEQKVAAATARMIGDIKDCNGKFAAGYAKSAVARTDCINRALNAMQSFYPYPDLLDRFRTNRNAIAEKFSAGGLTLARANEQLNEQRRIMIDEETKRLPDAGAARAGSAGYKPRHGTLFDAVLKTPVQCGPSDPSVNCL